MLCACVCVCVAERVKREGNRDMNYLISHNNMPHVYHDFCLNWAHAEGRDQVN